LFDCIVAVSVSTWEWVTRDGEFGELIRALCMPNSTGGSKSELGIQRIGESK